MSPGWPPASPSRGGPALPRPPDHPGILMGRGGVAQLVERYVRNVEAEGSSPFTSTRVTSQSLWDV
jgi:hypothetical protein